MRQRLALIITVLVVITVLIALNAASYVKVEPIQDSEGSPDRSTFNSGATGTRAFYDYLRESGYQVARWRESTSSLLGSSGQKAATLVIIGPTAVPFTKDEYQEILTWVRSGGRLVLIDRSPDHGLLPPSGEWRVVTNTSNYPAYVIDPNNLEQMTAGVQPVHASQPTAMARGVESVLPSQFAAEISIVSPAKIKNRSGRAGHDNERPAGENPEESPGVWVDPDQPPPVEIRAQDTEDENPVSPAPVIHFEQERGALLIDYPHGKGRIVLLSDPFIVANNGISRADNLMLALNVVAGTGGLIAFDEFHQGHASSHNALIQYFSGTPVLAICGQLVLIGLAIVWSRGRRFARPLPLPHVDRRSSLEFVASMAELQQRAKAHDLALENIYGRVRRVLVRHAGLSNSSPRAEIASRVALRSGLDRQQLETLMRTCEDTINGAPTNAKEILKLARRLREVESRLGLRTRSRDARQEKTDL